MEVELGQLEQGRTHPAWWPCTEQGAQKPVLAGLWGGTPVYPLGGHMEQKLHVVLMPASYC